MAMRRETGMQSDLMLSWAEMPRSPGHAFYQQRAKPVNDLSGKALR